jgi:hypothetical protein
LFNRYLSSPPATVAMADDFQPLISWLGEQNKGIQIG